MAATSAPSPCDHRALRRVADVLPALLRQLALIGGLFLLYRLGRNLAGDDVSRALQNGSNLWHLERTLHLPSEETLQQFVLHKHELVRAANWYYVGAHFPVTVAFLVALFLFRRPQYARVRNAMAVATGLGLAIHIVYPLAPPRLLSDIGMVDTGSVFGPSPYNSAVRGAANQFAAMPSLHVGWAVLIGIVAWRVMPHGWRWLGVFHATLTTLVVVVTANHYWIDGVVGSLIVIVALRLTRPRLAMHALHDDEPVRRTCMADPQRALRITTDLGSTGLEGAPRAAIGTVDGAGTTVDLRSSDNAAHA